MNRDNSRNTVRSSESGMAASSKINLVPGKSSTTTASPTSVSILPQDAVLALLQSYFNSHLLQTSRSQSSGVSHSVDKATVLAMSHDTPI